MEKIFKKVCTYKSKSHTQGLLPFVSGTQKYYVNSADTNGNWGHYVCDFGYISNIELNDYADFFDKIIINDKKYWQYRYKYSNLIKQYHFISKAIRKGVILKKVKKSEKTLWVNKFDDIVERYNYIPYNIDDFKPLNEYEYEYIKDENKPISDFIILVENVDKILEYNKMWVKWKEITKDFIYDNLYWDINKSVENNYIGTLYIPSYIKGDKVPAFLHYSDISEWNEWFNEAQRMSGDCCTLKEWIAKGGDEMKTFLSKDSVRGLLIKKLDEIKKWETFDGITGKKYLNPYIDFSILIDDEYKDYGVLTTYEDEYYTPKIDNTIKGHFVEINDGGKIESQLDLVRYNRYIYDDNGVLPGIFDYSDGKIYKVTIDGIIEIMDSDSLSSCDEINKALDNATVYYPTFIVEEVIEYLRQNKIIGFVNVLPFYVTPLKMPYKEGIAYNISSIDDKCYGDYIVSIKYPDKNLIEINYNIGGNITCGDNLPIIDDSIEKHGMTLKEVYPYYPNDTIRVKYNNIEFEIGYEHIDFESKMTSATTPDLGIVRENVLLADVTGLFVDDLSGITKSILFKKENNSGLSFQPKEDISIEMNRGSAAAFEPHFKLSECNTMEDLENYGNNYFNL